MDEDGTGDINFEEFLRMMELQKFKFVGSHDADTVAAFVALGGGEDKTGEIHADRLREVCQELGLTIDIESLLEEIDTDQSYVTSVFVH